MPTRISLSENNDFRSIRNAVIRAALELSVSQDIDAVEGNDPVYVTKSITGLLNSVGKVFRDKFKDNPECVPKVDVKLRRKIVDKEQAHGLKHG